MAPRSRLFQANPGQGLLNNLLAPYALSETAESTSNWILDTSKSAD